MSQTDETREPLPLAVSQKMVSKYAVSVDPKQDDKATELKVCSFAPPHMRAFHFSWLGFFIAFFIWFAIAPLLPIIKDDLKLSASDIWTTNICAVMFDLVMRFIFGAVCDKYGARIPMGCVLMFASIPTACIGLVNNLGGLIAVRLFIGVAGSTFVTCQCWSTRMFTKDIVGVANGLVGGWGNVGGGATQIVMGTGLFPLFKYMYDGDEEQAWRTVTIVPAVVAFMMGMIIIRFGQDCPKGNYSALKKSGEMIDISAAASFRSGALDLNTWVLFIHYACCFGVELTVNNTAVSFFNEYFDLPIATASAIASIFGFMNLFARGVGGYLSDRAMPKFGLRGRILVQAFLLLAEGGCIFIFAFVKNLALSIVMLTIFSIFVQAAEGSTYGIVPYVNRFAPGAVAGIVGAGGPAGAIIFGLIFKANADDQRKAFFIMACIVCASGFISVLITIKGHRGLIFGKDQEPLQQITIPSSAPKKNDEEKGETTK